LTIFEVLLTVSIGGMMVVAILSMLITLVLRRRSVSDELRKQVANLESRLSFLEGILNSGLSLTDAAPLIGLSRETIRRRILEAIANPHLSALREGVHFERRGRNKVILDISATKKAIAINDVIFGRRKKPDIK
jgi:hypothetical protein